MRRVISVIIISIFLLSSISIAAEKEFERLSTGMSNILYGGLELPDNMDETNSKGTKAFPECTDATKDGVARTITRVVGGIFQVATFWYTED